MEFYYQRNVNQSYMILEGDIKEADFEKEMLKENDIHCLLTFYSLELNNRIQFWYEITGKKSLRDYGQQEGIDADKVLWILTRLQKSLEELDKYLISSNHVVINPDALFLEKNTIRKEMYLCYCPTEEITSSLESVMEFLISVVDHSDKEATDLCYELYELTCANGASVEQLLEHTKNYLSKSSNISNEQPNDNYNSRDKGNDSNLVVWEWIEDDKTGKKQKKESLREELPVVNNLEIYDSERKSFWEKIKELLVKKKNEKIEPVKKKKQQLFPKDDEWNDIIYDPKDDYYEPTVLLKDINDKTPARLMYIGRENIEDISLNKAIIKIGSGKDNDYIINNSCISRFHAQITNTKGVLELLDFNSTNGSSVNDIQIPYNEKIILNIGDEVCFANIPFKVV